MPLLGALIQSLFVKLFGLFSALAAGKLAIRYSVMLFLAGLYISAVAVFNSFISPLISALFSTSFGQIIGLAFPPMAGTVIAGYTGLWATLMAYRYMKRFGQMAIPG